jgi:NAD dependent epimerase/dehydratase
MGFWEGRVVLVTGAGGFIGSHLAEELVLSGAKVRALVRYNSRNDWGMLELLREETRGAMDVVSGDIRDAPFVRKAVQSCEIVFHLAALIAIPYSYVASESFLDTNVRGTLNVLQAGVDTGVRRIVHTSTSEVYGSAQYTPIDEGHPLRPQSPYAATKVAADMLAESFCCSYGLPVSVVRPFNTYGPRQSARAVIPTVAVQALTGDVIRLGSLDTTRDMTFIQDTVRGFLKVAESSETVGEVVNLGTATGVSVRQLVDKIGQMLGKELRIEVDDQRLRPDKSEVATLIGAYGKASRLTGWTPQVDLDEGLHQTTEWLGRHLDRYKPGMYNI